MSDRIRQHEYVTVPATLKARTDKAALLDTEDLEMPAWVPIQALHFASKKDVASAAIGDEIEVRVEERMARQKGLV